MRSRSSCANKATSRAPHTSGKTRDAVPWKLPHVSFTAPSGPCRGLTTSALCRHQVAVPIHCCLSDLVACVAGVQRSLQRDQLGGFAPAAVALWRKRPAPRDTLQREADVRGAAGFECGVQEEL